MIIPALQRERSLDDYVDGEEGSRLVSLIADRQAESQEEKLYHNEVRWLVREALVRLDEREQHIIRNRFGLLGGRELTLEEIGRSLNLSRERVRQLERDAKNKLRAQLAPHQMHLRFSLA